MTDFLLTKHFRLKLLSPLHIGGREQIPFYMIVCLNGKCYVLDEIRVGEELAKRGEQFVDQFVQFAGQERARLSDFLEMVFGRNRGNWAPFLENARAYSVKAKSYPRTGLHPFIRDALYRPYVPGTSIKGAIRTAVMYLLLKRMHPDIRRQTLNNFVEKKLKEIKSDLRSGQRGYLRRKEIHFDQDLDVSLMWKYYFDQDIAKFDPHSDIMRAVKVSDTQPIDRDAAVIEEIEVYNRGYGTGIKIYVETLPAGTELAFSITFDTALLGRFRKYTKEKFGISLNEVVEIVSNPIKTLCEWTQDLFQHERKSIKNPLIYHFAHEPNINLGWGGGFLTKTIDLLLPENTRAEILSLFKRRRFYLPAPSSRRLTGEGRPLGWGKIEEV